MFKTRFRVNITELLHTMPPVFFSLHFFTKNFESIQLFLLELRSFEKIFAGVRHKSRTNLPASMFDMEPSIRLVCNNMVEFFW